MPRKRRGVTMTKDATSREFGIRVKCRGLIMSCIAISMSLSTKASNARCVNKPKMSMVSTRNVHGLHNTGVVRTMLASPARCSRSYMSQSHLICSPERVLGGQKLVQNRSSTPQICLGVVWKQTESKGNAAKYLITAKRGDTLCPRATKDSST